MRRRRGAVRRRDAVGGGPAARGGVQRPPRLPKGRRQLRRGARGPRRRRAGGAGVSRAAARRDARLGGAQVRRRVARERRALPDRRRPVDRGGRRPRRRRPDDGHRLCHGRHDGPADKSRRLGARGLRPGPGRPRGGRGAPARDAAAARAPRDRRPDRVADPGRRAGRPVGRPVVADDQDGARRHDGGRHGLRRDLVRADAQRVPPDARRVVGVGRRARGAGGQVGLRGVRREGLDVHDGRRASLGPHEVADADLVVGERERVRDPEVRRRRVVHPRLHGLRRDDGRRRAHDAQAVRLGLLGDHLRETPRGGPRDHVEEHRRRLHRGPEARARGVPDPVAQVRRGHGTRVLRRAGPAPVGHGAVHRRLHPRLRPEHLQPRVPGHRHPRAVRVLDGVAALGRAAARGPGKRVQGTVNKRHHVHRRRVARDAGGRAAGGRRRGPRDESPGRAQDRGRLGAHDHPGVVRSVDHRRRARDAGRLGETRDRGGLRARVLPDALQLVLGPRGHVHRGDYWRGHGPVAGVLGDADERAQEGQRQHRDDRARLVGAADRRGGPERRRDARATGGALGVHVIRSRH
mmetsp:Transcript_4191/g.13072  ORF Transcript_4191/g.13072 Transcript_4191/m.13072 type:complete len:577 (+) Transcript_4191:269-1999(+)